MWKFIVNRLLWTVVTVIAVAFVIFTILYFCPGDPAMYKLGNEAKPADIAYLRHKWGLDRPYLEQLVDFLFSAFIKFDWGESWTMSTPIWPELFDRLPRTLVINILGMGIGTTCGILLGIYAGVHGGQWQDSLVMMIAMVLISVPGFVIALFGVVIFAVTLGWLPVSGIGSWKHYVLPIGCGALGGIASEARQVRSAILEVFRDDYITTARAKGVPEKKVIFNHMLPNAMIPILTGIGARLAMIVGGSAIIENIFSIPGVGSYMLTGSTNRDYPVLRATTIFMCTFSTLVMLLTDLAYGFIDPRIKAQYSGGRRK